ncbi:MAG: 2Fe-2S iron-sulfur cluster-binding protein [Usitatibacter sp.]
MPETLRIVLQVLRYTPQQGAEPRFESFPVEFTRDLSVLPGLQKGKAEVDGALPVRWAGRMAICGSCGMMIDGVPKLACRAFLRDFLPGPVRVEPLEHFPIERDLVVDISDFVNGKLPSVRPWIEPREPRRLDEGEYLQTPAELERIESFSHCINCMLCYSACPQYGLDPKFLGPAATALLQRYNDDSRDGAQAKRMELVNSEEGVWSCTAVGYCSEVCPKAVDPANAVNRNKTASAVSWFARFLPGRS